MVYPEARARNLPIGSGVTDFAEQPVCPKCQGHDIGRWGFQNERQRYRCKTCKATFNAFSGTPLARLRYPEKWNDYLTGMTYSMTLRASASEYGVSLETAFRWRHHFLEVINNDQAEELKGITELDETFFRESFKGQRKGLPRPTRKRGNDPNKARKVPVLVARDREKNTLDGILENESANELCRHLNGRISIEGTVCADAHLAHEKLAEAACKSLVKQRMCRSGMRWKEQGASMLLTLRALVCTSGQWNSFWAKMNRYGFPVVHNLPVH